MVALLLYKAIFFECYSELGGFLEIILVLFLTVGTLVITEKTEYWNT